jgi:hypothetical protein
MKGVLVSIPMTGIYAHDASPAVIYQSIILNNKMRYFAPVFFKVNPNLIFGRGT